MSTSHSRLYRPPVRWATHWQHILLVLSVVVGGSLFGVSFVLWPQRPVERVLGVLIMVGVGAMLVWLVTYLTRPVEKTVERRHPRR